MERARAEDWESRVRHRPSQAQVRQLVAWSLTSGEDPIVACVERWGSEPAELLRRAPPRSGDRRGRGGPGLANQVDSWSSSSLRISRFEPYALGDENTHHGILRGRYRLCLGVLDVVDRSDGHACLRRELLAGHSDESARGADLRACRVHVPTVAGLPGKTRTARNFARSIARIGKWFHV